MTTPYELVSISKRGPVDPSTKRKHVCKTVGEGRRREYLDYDPTEEEYVYYKRKLYIRLDLIPKSSAELAYWLTDDDSTKRDIAQKLSELLETMKGK